MKFNEPILSMLHDLIRYAEYGNAEAFCEFLLTKPNTTPEDVDADIVREYLSGVHKAIEMTMITGKGQFKSDGQ
jgi:hypothetical protein